MMKRLLKRYYLLVLFALMIPVSLARVAHNPRSVIWSDAEGYYKYLPAVFVLKDVHQMPAGSVAPLLNEKGEYLNKYTMGVAYFQLPFYLVFYAAAASDLHKPEAIFHDAWALSVALSGLFTGFLGLWLLQLALRRNFQRRVVFWTLLSVFLGTNLFHYATREMGMSHVYSFALMAFLVWYVPGFYRAPDWKNALVLGAALGWIVLIRPTNLVVVLFVLLWEVYDWPALRERLLFLKYKLHLAPVAVLAGLAIWLPQLCYWHEMTGSWLRYSYTNEGFIYWKAPKIAEVLLDPQNGLFIYTPMAFLMLAGGGVRDLLRKRHSAPAVLLIFVLSTYLFSSWWAWWFGGAFGARSYVELYALFSLPLAGLYERIFSISTTWLRNFILGGCAFLLYYSIRLSFLYNILPGPWDGPDWRWNWEKVFWIWSHLF